MQLNDDNDGKTECAADDGDVSTSTSTLSMPVPLTSTSNHHQHLRPPTPDHFIAVSPPSPPRSRPHRPSPAMIPAPQTDDSIVAHALLSRATSLPHSRASSHHASTLSPPAPVTTTPTPSPPLSSSFTPSNDHHSRVSCWSSGTAPHLSRSGTSVPSAELSSKDHMALAGWSWETSTATESIGTANAYPPPPSAHERQVRLPLTLDDLASGRPVVGHNGHGRRHESAPPVAASVAASDRPFSVWGVR
ncbi:hypothetical protein BCR44DRAFT_41942 [Catenaria anguillulae PL171]|uniref:Uncharacterized protein n=1 Tax=Catenaria anguillulae PL171 TaxID=765915 RepID=A0A1Y2HMT5_9FUNG|nr:hypothetical protein BCR44DRAFT_41942 [Catenaria anguillulae PL171]